MRGRSSGNCRTRVAGDAGFSMIELLVASTLSLVIAFAALGLMDATTSVSTQELQRQAALGEARAGLQRMVRELRGATSVNSTAGNLLDFNATTPSGTKRILYACNDIGSVPGLRSCTRYSGPTGGTVSGGQIIIDRLVNGTTSSPVFRYLPDRIRPTEVQVQVVLPAKGDASAGYAHSIVINDAAFLRNIDLTGT